MPQIEPRQAAAANRLIDKLLQTLLDSSARASRVCLAAIDGVASDRTTMSSLRYSITNSVAAHCRPARTTLKYQPVSGWSDFLPELLAGQCALAVIPAGGTLGLLSGVIPSRASRVLVCPVVDRPGQLLGAIFVLRDGAERPPDVERFPELMAAAKRVASPIAGVWGLCRPEFQTHMQDIHLELV